MSQEFTTYRSVFDKSEYIKQGYIITYDDLDSVDDLPELSTLERQDIYHARTGDLSSDYIVPVDTDESGSFDEWRSLVDGEEISGTPDSVALYLFDEGSGSTFGDSDGDADGSFINGSWVSDSEAVGGFMAENSDSDRLGEVAVSDQPTIGDTGFVISTFEFPDVSGHGDNNQFWTHNGISDDNRLQFSTDEGDWFVGITDENRFENDILSFEDNTKYRLGVAWDNGDYRILHNGNIVRSGSYSGSLSLNEAAWTWGGRSDTDTGATETKHDNTRIGSVYPTEAEIEADYNDQPWS